MKVIGIHCPYCGGNIKFDIDIGNKQCFCIHCGQQIILDDEVIRTEHTERTVDEARIHEANVNERIRLKELAFKEKELDSERKQSKMHLIVSGVWCIVMAIIVIFSIFNDDILGGVLFGGGLWVMIGLLLFVLEYEKIRKK